MKELKAGVIGLGLGRHFVAACGRSALVGHLVVCDPDEGRRRLAQKEEAKVSGAYDSMEAMLGAETLDAVCVVTPDHMHRPHAETCLDAGCHVLMTKPLATNLEDGRAIARAAESSGKIVMVAHERRFRARNRAIKTLLDEGRLGEPIFVQASQVSDRRGHFTKSPWYAAPEAGRTALVGSGIHEVDLIRFLIDRPIRTVSAGSNRLGELDFPRSKTTATVFQFQGGVIGQTMVSYEVRWPPKRQVSLYSNHFLLAASHGVVHGPRYRTDSDPDWVALPVDDVEIAAGCGGSVDAFLSAVIDGGDVPVSVRDAYATLAACVAADESADTGKTLAPDSEDFE